MNERIEIDKDFTLIFEEYVKKEPLENEVKIENDSKMEIEEQPNELNDQDQNGQRGRKRSYDESNTTHYFNESKNFALPILFTDGCPTSLQAMNLVSIAFF